MARFVVSILIGYVLIVLLFFGIPKILKHKSAGPANSSQAASSSEGVPMGQKNQIVTDQEIPDRIEIEILEDENKAIETFYKNGMLSSEWLLDNQSGAGTFKAYFVNGQLWLEMGFLNSVLAGIVTTYYPSGEVFAKENFVLGIQSGESRFYYENGNIWLKKTYVDGVVQGIPKLYSEDGREETLPSLKTDEAKASGYFKAYDATGEVVMDWKKAGDSEETTIKTKFADQTTSSEWSIKNAKLHGKARLFSPDGKLLREDIYEEGLRKEYSRIYYANGKTWVRIKHLENGGTHTEVYYPQGMIWFSLDERVTPKNKRIFSLQSYWEDVPAKQKQMVLF